MAGEDPVIECVLSLFLQLTLSFALPLLFLSRSYNSPLLGPCHRSTTSTHNIAHLRRTQLVYPPCMVQSSRLQALLVVLRRQPRGM